MRLIEQCSVVELRCHHDDRLDEGGPGTLEGHLGTELDHEAEREADDEERECQKDLEKKKNVNRVTGFFLVTLKARFETQEIFNIMYCVEIINLISFNKDVLS